MDEEDRILYVGPGLAGQTSGTFRCIKVGSGVWIRCLQQTRIQGYGQEQAANGTQFNTTLILYST